MNPCIAHPPALCKTGRCSLERLRGGSKFNYNIGKHGFWINNPKMARPQDIVALDNEQNGNFNFARMTYVGDIPGLMSSKKRPVSYISQA